jgi:hypothetical protein
MGSKSAQWIFWAIVMFVFTGLTLAGRWIDLSLAMTIVAVFWYGIVPEGRTRDNEAAERATVRKR